MDKDNIRVDLLKFRRKAYFSYPVDSPERKMFIKTLLQNELKMTEKEIPQSLINFIVDGKSVMFWNAFKKSLPWLALATLSNVAFATLLSRHYVKLSYLFLLFGTGCFVMIIHYFYEYWIYSKSTHEAQRYLNDMNKYMNRISNDIKRLEGPR